MSRAPASGASGGLDVTLGADVSQHKGAAALPGDGVVGAGVPLAEDSIPGHALSDFPPPLRAAGSLVILVGHVR